MIPGYAVVEAAAYGTATCSRCEWAVGEVGRTYSMGKTEGTLVMGGGSAPARSSLNGAVRMGGLAERGAL